MAGDNPHLTRGIATAMTDKVRPEEAETDLLPGDAGGMKHPAEMEELLIAVDLMADEVVQSDETVLHPTVQARVQAQHGQAEEEDVHLHVPTEAHLRNNKTVTNLIKMKNLTTSALILSAICLCMSCMRNATSSEENTDDIQNDTGNYNREREQRNADSAIYKNEDTPIYKNADPNIRENRKMNTDTVRK